MKSFLTKITICLFIVVPMNASANEAETLNVYESIVNPILEAKCVSCHGAEKDKGKLRMHTKDDLLKGGRGAGSAIIVKGEIEESELIFRITLPKDDDEAMPPMEDETHYNPVTSQELSVLQSWIKLGASFDMLINDLDNVGKEAAAHVLKNLPEKKASATALLIPKLPEVPIADDITLKKIRNMGILIMPIAQNTNALYVNASYNGKSFDDKSLEMLLPIAPQLVWLNLSKTSITDKGLEVIKNLSLLERLHLENTEITDVSTVHISELSNLKYLNLYGTNISDQSIGNLRKLKRLEKVFLWQTNVTPDGAVSLRKYFVDKSLYSELNKEKNLYSAEKELILSKFSTQIKKLEDELISASESSTDTNPINEKCPVANKPIDQNKYLSFEGRKVGFCCDKCKTKFDKDEASYRSKITSFEPAKKFTTIQSTLKSIQDKKDQELEDVGAKLKAVSLKLNSMGPEINLGWSVITSE